MHKLSKATLALRTAAVRMAAVAFLVLLLIGAIGPQAAQAGASRQVAGEGWAEFTLPAAEHVHFDMTANPSESAPSGSSRPYMPLAGPQTKTGVPDPAAGVPAQSPVTMASSPSLPAAPTDFSVYQNTALSSATSPVEVNSPSAANNGRNIFLTYNNYAALSTDYGGTWSYINPDTEFTSLHAGFGGDQDAFYDASRDQMLWLIEYLPDGTGNALRISSAKSALFLQFGVWNTWNFPPTTYCGGTTGFRFDRPQLAITSNYLYLAANIYNSSNAYLCSTLIRFSLNELAAGGGLNVGVYFTDSGFNFTPAQGGTTTLYFARHEDTTHLRVYDWPESVGPESVTSVLVSHSSYLGSGYNCTIYFTSINPCATDDDRLTTGWLRRDTGELGFMWDAAQGTDGIGTFAFPYVRVLTMNASTKAVLTETEIWSSTQAYLLASSGVNARGHVGGTIAFAGGLQKPNCSAWIYDDLTTSFNPAMVTVTSGDTAPSGSEWGAYLRTRESGLNPFQWLGTCYDIESGIVTPHVVRFGRARDTYSRMKVDYNVDGTSDVTVYRPSTGIWYIRKQFNSFWGGVAGDVPVPGDYDGDGRSDVAIWRPSTGVFYIKHKFNSGWGTTGDVPVPGDYNGDGKTDVAIFRPSSGIWYIKGIGNFFWGTVGDIPVPGDYNGDGKTELAVFRPSTGIWYIKNMANIHWGTTGDLPVQGDYNNDGITDIAVFRPSNGTWYVRNVFNTVWGTATDIPVPGDYNADGNTDVAIFSPSSGIWYVRGQFNASWGTTGDFPVEAPDTNGDGTPYQ